MVIHGGAVRWEQRQLALLPRPCRTSILPLTIADSHPLPPHGVGWDLTLEECPVILVFISSTHGIQSSAVFCGSGWTPIY